MARFQRQKAGGMVWVLLCLLCLPDPVGAAVPQLEPALTPASSWLGPPQELRRGLLTVAHTPSGPQLSVSRLGLPLAASTESVSVQKQKLHWLWPAGAPEHVAGAYFRAPAVASLTQVSPPGEVPVWHFQAQSHAGAPSGLWLRLYDPTVATALDSRHAAAVGFWLRPEGPAANLRVRLADAAHEARETAHEMGLLRDYYWGTPVGGWQAVRVPLPATGLERGELAQLILTPEGTAPVSLALRGVALLGAQATEMPPVPTALPAPEPAPRPWVRAAAPARALWIWDAERELLDPAQQAESLDALAAAGVTRLFVQLTGPAEAALLSGEIAFEPARWAPLLRAAHQRGLRVYALDGDPRYAEPAFHAGVLATQRRLLAYNRHQPPEARFAGLQYDIEPYLLPGYFGARQRVLQTGLLELVARLAQERHQAQAGDFDMGLAVPFWLDAPDEWSGQRPVLTHGGQTRLWGDHLLAHVDHLAVMNYRTRSQGPGGLLANAEDLLRRSAAQGKQLWVGLETLPLPAEDHYAFAGAPQAGWPQVKPEPQLALVVQPQRWELYFLAAGETASLPETARSRPVWHWPLRPAGHTDPRDLSFAALGRARLEQEVAVLQKTLGAVSAYQGVVIHDLAGWRALSPG